MIVRDLDELEPIVLGMKGGERLNLEQARFGRLWPRPPFTGADDYLSDEERAAAWCGVRGCTIREQYDPPALVIQKMHNGGTLTGRQPSEPEMQRIRSSEQRIRFSDKRIRFSDKPLWNNCRGVMPEIDYATFERRVISQVVRSVGAMKPDLIETHIGYENLEPTDDATGI